MFTISTTESQSGMNRCIVNVVATFKGLCGCSCCIVIVSGQLQIHRAALIRKSAIGNFVLSKVTVRKINGVHKRPFIADINTETIVFCFQANMKLVVHFHDLHIPSTHLSPCEDTSFNLHHRLFMLFILRS